VPTGNYTTGTSLLTAINGALSTAGVTGVTASLDASGHLQFGGTTAFSITDTTATPTLISGAQYSTVGNSGNYTATGVSALNTYTTAAAQTITVNAGGQTYTVGVALGQTLAQAVASLNTQLAGSGVYAIEKTIDATHSVLQLQSANSFTMNSTTNDLVTATASTAVQASVPNATVSALGAIGLINNAIQTLGTIQGQVGAGENLLQYASNLAQTQIANYSSAESQIKDANVASAAANLTKSQVLEQTAIAAMAQANSEPQAVLKLLQ
jgi:flagellin